MQPRVRFSVLPSYAGRLFGTIPTLVLGEGEGVTTHIRSYSYYELSSCMPVTPVTAAAFGIIVVEMPVCPLSEGYCLGKKGVCFWYR